MYTRGNVETENIGASQPKVTCRAWPGRIRSATQIRVTDTLATLTFHAPRGHLWRHCYIQEMLLPEFSGENQLLASDWITRRERELLAGSRGELEKQPRCFDPYFHILNTWLNFLPTKHQHGLKCCAWLLRQRCQPVFPWPVLGRALLCTCFPD